MVQVLLIELLELLRLVDLVELVELVNLVDLVMIGELVKTSSSCVTSGTGECGTCLTDGSLNQKP